MREDGTSAEEPDLQYSPTEDPTAQRTPHRRRATWTPPEIVAVVLIVSTVFSVGGSMFELNGFVSGWRDTIIRWFEWASQPYVPIVLVLASLIAWYLVTLSRDGLFAAGDSEHDGSQDGESDDLDAAGTAELWDRGRRAVAIAGLSAACGAFAALAVILLVIEIEWPTSGPSLLVYSHVDGVLLGLAGLVPAVTTVVIFRHVRDVWRDLIYTEEPTEAPLDVPS
jgi:hypothetical protein